jgi:hypothetical protein
MAAHFCLGSTKWAAQTGFLGFELHFAYTHTMYQRMVGQPLISSTHVIMAVEAAAVR